MLMAQSKHAYKVLMCKRRLDMPTITSSSFLDLPNIMRLGIAGMTLPEVHMRKTSSYHWECNNNLTVPSMQSYLNRSTAPISTTSMPVTAARGRGLLMTPQGTAK